MKNILVPVDFSKNSENATKYAILLAAKLKAKLFLFHSFYSPHASGHLSTRDADSGKKTGHELSIQDLKDLYTQCSPLTDQNVEYLSSQKELREELPEIIRNNNIDLLVMGTQGIGWLEGKVFGTNTSWAIENLSCPILAIPETETPLEITHITYASQFLDSDIANLKAVSLIIERFSADVTVIHIESHSTDSLNQQLNNFKEKLKKEMNFQSIAFKSIIAPNVEEALENYIKEHPVNLLVMSAQQRDMYDKVFGKSITRLMVHRLKSPILFFHHR